MIRKITLALMAIVLVAALVGCAGTKVTNSWKSEQAGAPVKRILILAVAESNSARQNFEAEFSRQLKMAGATGLPSFHFLPTDKKASVEEIVKVAEENQVDSVLVSVVLGVDSQKNVTTLIQTDPGLPYSGFAGYGWYGPYSGGYTTVHSYSSDIHTANIESSLYRLKSEEKVWSALTETTVLNQDMSNIKKIAEALAQQLTKDGMI